MNKKLSFDEVKRIAVRLGVDPCALWAVCQVESQGDGFLPDGRAKILFEGHVFWKELQKRGMPPSVYLKNYPDIVYPVWTKAHYKGGVAEYDRLKRAMIIQPDAAFCSASWGMFQIMGFNHKRCGYASVTDFVNAMQKSAELQLEAVCSFLASGNMLADIKALDWQSFARQYNGPGYAQNKYDVKLRQAYEQCKNTQ